MDLTPILSESRLTIFDKLKASWYFETLIDKIVLVGLSGLGVLRIIQWVF